MDQVKLPKMRSELVQPNLTRPDWVKSSSRNPTLLFLDKNENTDPIYVEFLKTEINNHCLDNINYYPDCSVLYNKLSQELGIPPENILLGAGSDGIIRYVFETFVVRGDPVVYTEPSFAMYQVYSDMFGARSCRVGYRIIG